MTLPRLAATVVAVISAGMPCALAADLADSPEFFEKRIRPILVEHCHKCHGDLKGKEPKGGLRVDSRAGLLKGGDNGPAIVPREPDKSRLIEAVRFKNVDLQMPPKGKLPDTVIDDLMAWVKAGAVWPNDAGTSATTSSFDLVKRKSEHWAWQPVRTGNLPLVKNREWLADAIDRFILAKLEEKGLKPTIPADKRGWIRRVTFDLTGLPPTPAEIDAFVVDSSSKAKATVVDRLLRSPRFGERWARHWLDLVRYAETRGHEFDATIPNAHQYRDYVIRALNGDVPYDQFVHEHIAGDLLPNPRRHPKEGFNESILGTGFWFLGEEVHSPVDIRQDQADRFDNRIDVLTKTFLGMTVSCARCHDHKFDAISTKDYYALYGFLQSSTYRQVRFDSLDHNRQVAEKLDELNRESAKKIAKALAEAAAPATKNLADYLMATRDAIRSGAEFGRSDKDVVFEDFESGTYAKWNLTGAAFGEKPHTLETIAPYQGKINGGGKYFVNSHDIRGGGDTAKGDALTGTMTSKEFKITHRYITMLVGGGSHAGKTCVDLVIGDKAVRTATGRDNNQMFAVRWDVAEFKDKTARIRIVDNATGGWGNIGVDDIVFTDRAAESPAVARAADFSPAFLSRIAEIAKAKSLDRAILTGWIEVTLAANADKTHLLHVWAKLSNDKAFDDPARLRELLASNRKQALAADAQVVVDYSRNEAPEWFPDEGAFRAAPVRPGYWLGDRFADYAAAEYDRVWDSLKSPPGSEVDTGALGKKPRAGRTLRTPNFRVAGKVHYFVKGAGMAYAAVDGHTLVNGPLHGQLVIEFPSSSEFRWVTHDLTPYKGHPAHIEFTPTAANDLAIAMVVQSDSVPLAASRPTFIPDSEIKSVDDLATAYQRVFQSVGRSPPKTTDEARLANALLSHAESHSTVKSARDEFLAQRSQIANGLRLESRIAPAIWDGNGFDEHVFIRGSPKGLGDRVPRRLLTALGGESRRPEVRGSGRLELARQITDPTTNPLVARVFVNRVWHHLFGRGLVSSVDNFGKLGELPTHPELLDYLADHFVRDGWSMKGLVRGLVLSSTYGMSAQGDATPQAADPQNLLLHRMRLRRLEGEAIRDAMLAVSGRLDETMYGPPIPIHLTPFLDGRGRPSKSGPIDGEGRRSLYLSVRRNFLNPMLMAFDTPIPFSTVGRRQVSNVPAQALILLNDPFVQQQAETWAKNVCAAETQSANRVNRMYRSAFGRGPTQEETAACLEFIKEQAARHKSTDADVKVWKDLAHTLFNTKEFIYVD